MMDRQEPRGTEGPFSDLVSLRSGYLNRNLARAPAGCLPYMICGLLVLVMLPFAAYGLASYFEAGRLPEADSEARRLPPVELDALGAGGVVVHEVTRTSEGILATVSFAGGPKRRYRVTTGQTPHSEALATISRLMDERLPAARRVAGDSNAEHVD